MYDVMKETIEGFSVNILTDKATNSHAKVIPCFGNNCFSFSREICGKQIDILESPPDLKTLTQNNFRFGNPVLFPFPNRIRRGEFTFEGREYAFELNPSDGKGNWIHGFVINRPWQVEDSGTCRELGAYLTCSFNSTRFPEIGKQFPFPFMVTMTYSLKDGILTISVDMKNIGDGNMPMGFGIHPYFHAPLGPDSTAADCTIRVPANKYWELVECLPTGRIPPVQGKYDLRSPQTLEGLQFDDVFTDLIFEGDVTRCILDDTKARIRVIVESDSLFREIVVYTPPRPSICFEPYTCVTDAVNLQPKGIDAGLISLKPGEAVHGTIRIIPKEY